MYLELRGSVLGLTYFVKIPTFGAVYIRSYKSLRYGLKGDYGLRYNSVLDVFVWKAAAHERGNRVLKAGTGGRALSSLRS